jgi:hypothetical protein
VTEGQFVHESTALTFPVGDVYAAADCVERLQEEPGLLDRLSRNAASSQCGKYSFDGSMNAWAEALDRCLALPVQRGPIPRIRERIHGRLSRLGMPVGLQSLLREGLRWPIRHSDPGSEWPTSSGLMSDDRQRRFSEFAKNLEQSKFAKDLASS